MAQFMQYPYQMFGNPEQIMNNQSNYANQPSELPSFPQPMPQFNTQFSPYINMPIGSNNPNNYSNINPYFMSPFPQSMPFNNIENIDAGINGDLNTNNDSDTENDYDSDIEYESDIENEDITDNDLMAENELGIENMSSMNNYYQREINRIFDPSFEDSHEVDNDKFNNNNKVDSDKSSNYSASKCFNTINKIPLSEEEKDKLAHSLVNVLTKYLQKVESREYERNDNNNYDNEDLSINIYQPSFDSSNEVDADPAVSINFHVLEMEDPNSNNIYDQNLYQENKIVNKDIEIESFLRRKRMEKYNGKLFLHKYQNKNEAVEQSDLLFNMKRMNPDQQYDKNQFYQKEENSDKQPKLSIEEEEEENLEEKDENVNEQIGLFTKNEEEKTNKQEDQLNSDQPAKLIIEEEEEDKSDEHNESNKSDISEEEKTSLETEITIEEKENKSDEQTEQGKSNTLEKEESSEQTESVIEKDDDKPDIQIEQNEKAELIIEEEEEDKSDIQENAETHLLKVPLEPIYLIPIKSDRNCSYDNINESIERGITGHPLEREIEMQLENEIASQKDDRSFYKSQLPVNPSEEENIQLCKEDESYHNEDSDEKNITMTLMEHTAEKIEDLLHVASPEEKIEKVVDVEGGEEEDKNNSSKITIHEPDNPSIKKLKSINSSSLALQEAENKKDDDEKANEIPTPNIDEKLLRQSEEDLQSKDPEKGAIIERGIKIDDEQFISRSSSQEIDKIPPDKITDESVTNSESSINSQSKDSKRPHKLSFAPQEPADSENSNSSSSINNNFKKRFSPSPRRNRRLSQDDISSKVHEPISNKRISPRGNHPHDIFSTLPGIKSSGSSNEIKLKIRSSSSLNLSEKIINSAPPEMPKKDATIIIPNPDESAHVSTSKSSQNIAIKISNSPKRGKFNENPPKKKKFKPSSSSSIQLPPELDKLMKKARMGEPLNNATIDQFKKLLFALNEERKILAKEHKYKEGLICNSTISHVSKFYEIAKKKLKVSQPNDEEENLNSSDSKVSGLKKKLDFFLVQGRFKEAEEIQKQIDEIKSESEKSGTGEVKKSSSDHLAIKDS